MNYDDKLYICVRPILDIDIWGGCLLLKMKYLGLGRMHIQIMRFNYFGLIFLPGYI